MFSPKCANTNCRAEFDFRHGRLFRIALPHSESGAESRGLNAAHFWLCDGCSVKYSVEFRGGIPILLKADSRDPARGKARRDLARACAMAVGGS